MKKQSNPFQNDEDRLFYSNFFTIVVFLFSLVLIVSGITLTQNTTINSTQNANALVYLFKLHISMIGLIFAILLILSAAFRWTGSKRKRYNIVYFRISWLLLLAVAVYTFYLLLIYTV